MQVNFAKYLDFFRKKQYHWYCTIFASVLTIRLSQRIRRISKTSDGCPKIYAPG